MTYALARVSAALAMNVRDAYWKGGRLWLRLREKGGKRHEMPCNHTFRGTGITAYLEHPDARLEIAQRMAGHSDPKTTRLYDRRDERVSLDEVERIGI